MPRKAESAEDKRASRIVTPRFLLRVGVAGAALVAGLYAWHRTEQFLIHDPRFAMALPDYGVESPSLHITGVQYASRMQVLRVFAPDYGRSLYLLPLKLRREQLRVLDWVKDASIARVWPNRVLVQIQEREPAAFLRTPSEQPQVSRFLLVDNEGAILQIPAHAHFTLPVALGISVDAPLADRRNRIHRLMTLMREIGPLGSRVSEVDVSDLDNLKVTARANNRAVVLMLGDHNFAKLLQNFIDNYGKIEERLSNANTLDMRLEDRITVVEGSSGTK